jgi:hypothetical protein
MQKASVQFFLDGHPLGNPVTSSPYAVNWDTTTATNGIHTLTAQATDSSGNVGSSASVSVTAQNPPPTMTCFVQQADVSVHGKGAVTTASFHTAMAGGTLLAFAASDGLLAPANRQSPSPGLGSRGRWSSGQTRSPATARCGKQLRPPYSRARP